MKEAPSPSMDLLPLWIARLHCTFLPQTPVYLVRRLPQREPLDGAAEYIMASC